GTIQGYGTSLLNFNGSVAVAGNFSIAGEQSADQVAWWDGASWKSMGRFTLSGQPGGAVMLLADLNGSLVVGGSFDDGNGSPANCVARWNGASWEDLGPPKGKECLSVDVLDGQLV